MRDLGGYSEKVENYILEKTDQMRDSVSLQKFNHKKEELQLLLESYLQGNTINEEIVYYAFLDRILTNILKCRQSLAYSFDINNIDLVKQDPVYQMLNGVDKNKIRNIRYRHNEELGETPELMFSEDDLTVGCELLEGQFEQLKDTIVNRSIKEGIYRKLYDISQLPQEEQITFMEVLIENMNMREGQKIEEYMIPERLPLYKTLTTSAIS